jgi:hypothetical protein
MMSFFVSVVCICAAMAFIGLSYESDARFGYEAFFSPLLFGAAASLPLLVKYSKKNSRSNKCSSATLFISSCSKSCCYHYCLLPA